ncbi:hypothetical protein JQS43_22660 [Natronosporangium hydrolyticum]|uniref:Uncharacterized protein n=1 Tax=Natronosporangium hydrolyticum TaxID=2811111 RepID=A0A895YKC0_9ACTN|nr:hypothetical protein [Natronosporangium hydrolyticum]QSB14278.1 hypothetical protein JQS43_22660 [Natronosporangium hydrolyticum]
MTRPWLRCGWAGLLTIATLWPGTPASGATTVEITVDDSVVEVGGELTVRLTGWPAELAIVELCGNDAARGAADCAVGAGVQTFPQPDGAATVRLPVTAPPVPCPCSVRVRDVAGTRLATTEVEVTGFAAEPPEEVEPPGELAIVDLSVRPERGWSAWFGGPVDRTILVTVRHAGGGPVADPPLTLLVGRGGHADTIAPAPDLAGVAVGEERSYEVPVELPAPALGQYLISGDLAGATFAVETEHYPWGVPTLLTGLLLVGGVGTARALRRRRAVPTPPPPHR